MIVSNDGRTDLEAEGPRVQTGYDLVWLAAERTPDQLAMADDVSDRRLTYTQLIAEVDAIAAGLAEKGIKQGTRTATVLPTTWEHALVLLALMRLAAVPALINFRLKPDQIAGLIEAGSLEAAVIPADPELAEAVATALPAGAPIWSVGGADGPALDFETCRGDPGTLPARPKPDPADLAFVFYTSGTTGPPKGVALPHRATEHRIVWLSTQAGLRHGAHLRTLGVMPLSHAIGFYGTFLVTLAYNGTFYLVSRFDPTAAVDLIKRERLTYAFCIPTLYHAIASAPNYAPSKVASLELVLYGGATIDPGLLNRMDTEWAATIRHIYGTTETMCSLYNPNPVGQHTRLRPGYYSHVRVVGPGGVDDLAAPGEEGELIVDVNTDAIFTGYLDAVEATQSKIKDGWYYTGDVLIVEGGGDYTFVGRADDLVRSGGENIPPEEVEAVLDACAGVAESAIIGFPDKKWGEVVLACVVAESGSAAAIDKHCRQSELAGFKRPKAYLFVEKLPRNAANKVLRRELRELALKAESGEGDLRLHRV